MSRRDTQDLQRHRNYRLTKPGLKRSMIEGNCNIEKPQNRRAQLRKR